MVEIICWEEAYIYDDEYHIIDVFRRCIREDLLDSIWDNPFNSWKHSGIREIAMQYCHQPGNAKPSNYIDSIVEHVSNELLRVILFTQAERDAWWMTNFGNDTHIKTDIYEFIRYTNLMGIHKLEHPKVIYKIICDRDEPQHDMELECVICQTEKPAESFLKTQCGHSFCYDCICSYVESTRFNRASCPLCRTGITSFDTTHRKQYESLWNHFYQSDVYMERGFRQVLSVVRQ